MVEPRVGPSSDGLNPRRPRNGDGVKPSRSAFANATMRSWNGWSLSLDSWIVQDGNYPDFAGGQQAEFAIEFYFPERRELDTLGEREGCLGGAAVGVVHDSAV